MLFFFARPNGSEAMLDTNKRAEQWVVKRAVWIFYGIFSPLYLFLNAVNIGLNFYNTSNIWTGFFSFIYSSRFYGELHMPQWNLVRSEFFKFKSVFFCLHINASPLSVLKRSRLALIFRNNCTYIYPGLISACLQHYMLLQSKNNRISQSFSL